MFKIIKKILKELRTIDYIVLVILLAGLLVVLFSMYRQKRTVYVYTVNEYNSWQENIFPPMWWISNSIRKGDVAYDTTGKEIAEVLSVENIDWGGERRTSRLKLKVYALYDNRTKQYRIKDQALSVGSKVSMKIEQTDYSGIIIYIGDTLTPLDSEYKSLEVELKAQDLDPWLADTYDESFYTKNTEGLEIFRILDSTIVPHERSVETADGRIVRSRDPYYKDVYITAIVRVRCQENVCYFNEMQPLKVGGWLWTQSENSFIKGNTRIIEVRELEN